VATWNCSSSSHGRSGRSQKAYDLPQPRNQFAARQLMKHIIDRTGHKVGRLTVLSMAERHRDRVHWLCRCECGNQVVVQSSSLSTKRTKSCGCLLRDVMVAKLTKHGHAPYKRKPSPEYNSWRCMRERCRNSRNNRHKLYGERGITVCERWMNSFSDFLRDMGPRPPGTSLDRIDNNGNYEPGNCRWATDEQQARNKRNSFRVTLNGQTYHANECAKIYGVNPGTFRDRLRHGWAVERAIKPTWGGK
jgi:hypothetical protein